MALREQTRWPHTALIVTVLLLSAWVWQGLAQAAESATDYPGTVVMADATAGKLVVKKDGGGSRFTFVVNDKTQYEGGPKSLKDIKQGAAVTVSYVVTGSQYVALKITAKSK